MEFIKRDIPQWDQYDLPAESDCWYDIYCDLIEQVHREVEEGALQLKQAVDKFYSDKASNAAVLVKDTNRLPKPRRRFQSGNSNRASEPKKNSIFRSNKNKVLAVPTHRLKTGASQINHVPQWLVDEHKQDNSSMASRKRAAPGAAPKTATASPLKRPITNGRSTQVTDAKPRIPRPGSTPGTKTPIIPRSQLVAPSKHPSDRSPVRTQVGHSDSTRMPQASPPARPLVRKRPTISQPNVFIQSKKRRM